MDGGGNFKIEKLGTDNYAFWRMDMYSTLVCRGLDVAVDDIAEEDGPTAIQCKKAKALIMLSVQDYHKYAIDGLDTAKEAWDYLEECYAGESAARRSAVKSQLNGLRLERAEGIPVYISRARGLQAQLEAAGEVLSETQLVEYAINGLPQQFDNVRAVLELQADALTVTQLMNKLLMVELRLRESEKKEEVCLQHRFKKTPWQAGSSGGKMHCYYCGQEGHYKRECPVKKKADYNGGNNPLVL